MNELTARLRAAGLIEGDSIVLLGSADSEGLRALISVTIEDFERMFGTAAEVGYEALVAADDNGDGTTKGYRRFFDTWRDAGILQEQV